MTVEVAVPRCSCGHGWPISRFPDQSDAEWRAYQARTERGPCGNCLINRSLGIRG